MNKTSNLQPASSSAPTGRDEADALVTSMIAALDRMDSLLQDETRLIKEARLGEAAQLLEMKTAAAGSYQRELEAIRAAAGVISRLVPDRAERLRSKMAGLQQTLSLNLAVVGTAKAVAEDMMRSVAADVGRRQQPAVYGASGAATVPRRAIPVSLSRSS